MLSYAPTSRGQLFEFPSSKAFLQSANLSRESYFGSFANTHREIWRHETCSIVRPFAGASYFSF